MLQCDKSDPRVQQVHSASVRPSLQLRVQLHLYPGSGSDVNPSLTTAPSPSCQLAQSENLMSDTVGLTIGLDQPGVYTFIPKPVLPRPKRKLFGGGASSVPMRVTVTVESTDLQCRLA